MNKKKPSWLRVRWNIIKLRSKGPWLVEALAPNNYKRWHLVLVKYHLMGMVQALGENRPMDYSVEEMASDGFVHEGYIHMAVNVLVAKGYLKRIDTPWSPVVARRVSYYVTEEGNGAVQSHALVYEGFFRRFKVLAAVLGVLSIVGGGVAWLCKPSPMLPSPDSRPSIEQESAQKQTPTQGLIQPSIFDNIPSIKTTDDSVHVLGDTAQADGHTR